MRKEHAGVPNFHAMRKEELIKLLKVYHGDHGGIAKNTEMFMRVKAALDYKKKEKNNGQ